MAHLKNRADLAEFPNGGHATKVRRYTPPLTRRQFFILAASRYETPMSWHDAYRAAARALVRLGLLEEDPQTRHLFRVTRAGADVVEMWRNAGWTP